MANYKIVKKDDIENHADNGEFRMMGKALGSDQVAISYRIMPAGYKSTHGHTHSKIDEIIYVTKGILSLKLDNDIVEVGPNMAVMIPPEVKRGYHNDGTEDVEMILASANGGLVGDNGGIPDKDWWPV